MMANAQEFVGSKENITAGQGPGSVKMLAYYNNSQSE